MAKNFIVVTTAYDDLSYIYLYLISYMHISQPSIIVQVVFKVA